MLGPTAATLLLGLGALLVGGRVVLRRIFEVRPAEHQQQTMQQLHTFCTTKTLQKHSYMREETGSCTEGAACALLLGW
jgi:hypothetical protein